MFFHCSSWLYSPGRIGNGCMCVSSCVLMYSHFPLCDPPPLSLTGLDSLPSSDLPGKNRDNEIAKQNSIFTPDKDWLGRCACLVSQRQMRFLILNPTIKRIYPLPKTKEDWPLIQQNWDCALQPVTPSREIPATRPTCQGTASDRAGGETVMFH